MLFSSNVFLYIFLPIVAIGYYLVHLFCKLIRFQKPTLKNYYLLFASLIFYTYGGGRMVFLLLFVVLFNYFMARIMGESPKKLQLVIAVSVNILLLVWFKYLDFLISGISAVVSLVKGGGISNPFDVVLPIGISFYVFQALSYVIDVYQKRVPVQKNPAKLMLYVSFFPQLIAGPIVRYADVNEEIDARTENTPEVYEGICRFSMGLGKKVLLADIMGKSVDLIFALDAATLSAPLAWAGILLYTMQIYYDFSGYSDMAIGMARIFGFHFKENFLHPYISQNITEFWKRWHVSLSSYLRDYLYIPLGGNRKGEGRTYVNLLIVFFICGLWHGAAWTFVAWGIYHGVLRVIENLLRKKCGFEMKGIMGRIVTFFLVMFGWILFRSSSFGQAFSYIASMFGAGSGEALSFYHFEYYITAKTAAVGIFSVIFAAMPFTKLREKWRGGGLHGAAAMIILLLSMFYLSGTSFNPFIYFQF